MQQLNVVHISLTPLAGSPIRIVNALRSHTNINTNLIVYNNNEYRTRTFENDLSWDNNNEHIISLLEAAHIIHMHHYFNLEHNVFKINFCNYLKNDKKLIRQFHSTPMTIANGNIKIAREIINSEIPQLVVAQLQERYYYKARVVPNIVPVNDELYIPMNKLHEHDCIRVCFFPSSTTSAWELTLGRTRWDTKGYPQTCNLLRTISRTEKSVCLNIQHGIPHADCLREKQAGDICIDEMVTGSYHLSSLESLSQGVPTFAHLDYRTLCVLSEITGANENPWMNFRLEEAEKPLRILVRDAALREQIGRYSRKWMEKYWNDRDMIQHYVHAYTDLMEQPDRLSLPRFNLHDKKTMWFMQGMNDAIWEARRQANAPLLERGPHGMLKYSLRRISSSFRRYMEKSRKEKRLTASAILGRLLRPRRIFGP